LGGELGFARPVNLRLREQRPGPILRRQSRLIVQRPLNPNRGVVPQNRPFESRSVKFSRLIRNFSKLCQNEKPVAEAGWDPKHPPILRTQHQAKPLAELSRVLAQIHGYVEDLTSEGTHEFALGLVELIVQPAQDTIAGARVIILHKPGRQAQRFERSFVVGLKKETSLVAIYLRVQDYNVVQLSQTYLQRKFLQRDSPQRPVNDWRQQKGMQSER